MSLGALKIVKIKVESICYYQKAKDFQRRMEFLLLSITLVLSGPILATEKIFERKVLVYALNHPISEVLF